jgi:hypothetical protein
VTRLAALLLAIPLTSGANWEVLSYRNIPPHTVRFDTGGLRIDVDRSSAPIVYPLAPARHVRGLRAQGRLEGQLRTTADRQGEPGADDYALRVGLVEVGTRRPGWMERRLAPAWVRRLFDLAPPDAGIAGIRFFNVGIGARQLGQARQHPASALITERVVAVPDADGRIRLSADFDVPVHTAAIWISVDGDDTASRFTLTLDRLALLLDDPGIVE